MGPPEQGSFEVRLYYGLLALGCTPPQTLPRKANQLVSSVQHGNELLVADLQPNVIASFDRPDDLDLRP